MSSRIHVMANACIALLVCISGYHLTRLMGGPEWAGWLIAGTVMIGIATVDSMQGALIARGGSGVRFRGAIFVILIAQIFGHGVSIWSSQLAFAVTQHRAIEHEAAQTPEALMHRGMVNQSIDLHNRIMRARTPAEKWQLQQQYSSILDRIATMPKGQSATEKAYATAGGSDTVIYRWSWVFAILLEMLIMAMATGKGAWLAADDQSERVPEYTHTRLADAEPVQYDYVPEQPPAEAVHRNPMPPIQHRRDEGLVKSGPSPTLQRDAAKVREAIECGELVRVSVRSIQPLVGGGADRRRKIIAALCDDGVLIKNGNGTVAVALAA